LTNGNKKFTIDLTGSTDYNDDRFRNKEGNGKDVMKRLVNFLCVSIFLLLGYSWETTANDRAAQLPSYWLNHNESELTRKWGPPTMIKPEGKGGFMLIYKPPFRFGQRQGSVGPNASQVAPEGLSPNVREIIFYVDNTGRIYNWRER